MSTSFFARLKAARERRDMTQAQLAARSQITPTAISHFEAGQREPSLANFRSLVAALDVNADYLLGLSDSTRRI